MSLNLLTYILKKRAFYLDFEAIYSVNYSVLYTLYLENSIPVSTRSGDLTHTHTCTHTHTHIYIYYTHIYIYIMSSGFGTNCPKTKLAQNALLQVAACN